MSIEKLTENVEIHQTLGNNPNTDNNLSAEQLKAKFDEPAKIIKRYINETLVPETERLDKDKLDAQALQEAIDEALKIAYASGSILEEIAASMGAKFFMAKE